MSSSKWVTNKLSIANSNNQSRGPTFGRSPNSQTALIQLPEMSKRGDMNREWSDHNYSLNLIHQLFALFLSPTTNSGGRASARVDECKHAGALFKIDTVLLELFFRLGRSAVDSRRRRAVKPEALVRRDGEIL